MRLDQIRADLAKLRKELDFISGQLDNERILNVGDLGELSEADINQLDRTNEKLLTEIIQLETMLEIK